VKKDVFGKWKKEEATIGYDDDHQHAESRIILERMASIITSDEAKKRIVELILTSPLKHQQAIRIQ
jgi:nitrogen regulatory protein PII